MPIGEFGGAPATMAEGSPALSGADVLVVRSGSCLAQSGAGRRRRERILFKNPLNPWSHTESAGSRRRLRTVRAHHPPLRQAGMGPHDPIGAVRMPVQIPSVWERPFCRLLHFERSLERRCAGRSRGC